MLVQKLVAFETAGRTFEGRAVLVADNADLGGPFEADADEVASTVLKNREVQKIYLRDLGAANRAEIVAAFDSGPGLVSYVGHGATAVWASENVFNNTDVSSLHAQGQQPLLLTLNCLNGFFHFPPFDTLAEALVKAEGKGALAAFSPSGLSLDEAAHVYHKALLAEIESGRHSRLGDAVLAAQSVLRRPAAPSPSSSPSTTSSETPPRGCSSPARAWCYLSYSFRTESVRRSSRPRERAKRKARTAANAA